jgi:autotransporter-associated beta strand protein
LLKSNTGTLILTNNNDGNTGSITVNAGTLQVGNNTTAGFIGNSVTVTNNAALVWYRSNDTNVENDIAGTGTLTKLGGAILSLNGDSTYTGATTVSSGTLRVNGSLGNTAVTVENGATLAVNGNIGGSVTIEAGATHALAVADTPANQVTRLIGGSLDLSAIGDILALDAASTPAAGTYILATATGGITGSPETINQTGVSGGFTIVGNNLVLTVGGNDYDDWAGPSGFNLTQAATGDDDGDGLTNFEEYAFGLDPTNPASVSPITAPDKTAGTFTYTRRKPSLTGLTYTYHSSTTLTGIWPAFTPPSADVSSNGDPVETITVTIPAILLDEPALFLRVEATQP